MSLDGKEKLGSPATSAIVHSADFGSTETFQLLDIPAVQAGTFPIKLSEDSLHKPEQRHLRSFVSQVVEHDIEPIGEQDGEPVFADRNMIVLPVSFLEEHEHILQYFGRFMTCIDGRKYLMEDYFKQNGFSAQQIKGFTSKLNKIIKYRGFGTLGGGWGAIGDMLKAMYDLLDENTKINLETNASAQEIFVMNMITYFSPELAEILKQRRGEDAREDNFKHTIYEKILTNPKEQIEQEGGAIADYLAPDRKQKLDYIRVNFHNGKHGHDHVDHKPENCFEGCGYLKGALKSDVMGLPEWMRLCLHDKITLCDDVYAEINEIIQEIKRSATDQLATSAIQENHEKISAYTHLLQDCQLIRRMPESFNGEHLERVIFVLTPSEIQLQKIFQDVSFVDTLPLPAMPRQVEIGEKRAQCFALNLIFQLKAAKQIRTKFDAPTKATMPWSVFAKKVYTDNIAHLGAVGQNLKVKTGLPDGEEEITAATLPIVLLEGNFVAEDEGTYTYIVQANVYNEGAYNPMCDTPEWFVGV